MVTADQVSARCGRRPATGRLITRQWHDEGIAFFRWRRRRRKKVSSAGRSQLMSLRVDGRAMRKPDDLHRVRASAGYLIELARARSGSEATISSLARAELHSELELASGRRRRNCGGRRIFSARLLLRVRVCH